MHGAEALGAQALGMVPGQGNRSPLHPARPTCPQPHRRTRRSPAQRRHTNSPKFFNDDLILLQFKQ